jgi:hypothetical protein
MTPDWFLFRCCSCGHTQAQTPGSGSIVLLRCCDHIEAGVDARPVHNAPDRDWIDMARFQSESPSSTQHTHD